MRQLPSVNHGAMKALSFLPSLWALDEPQVGAASGLAPETLCRAAAALMLVLSLGVVVPLHFASGAGATL